MTTATDRPADRTAERTPEQRAADPVSNTIIDDEGVLGEPAHDPVALSTALPLPVGVPPNLVPVATADAAEAVYGEPVPDVETLTGGEQQRIEVLTGKRLQRPDPPESEPPVTRTPQERADHERELREKRERERDNPKIATKPVVKPVVASAKA